MERNLAEIESQLLLITRQFLLEQETQRAVRLMTLDASLERQLGIDSLGKVELFHRIEKTFDIQLADRVMAEADTLQNVAQAILLAKPTRKIFGKQASVPNLQALEVDLSKVNTLMDVLIQYAIRDPERPHIYLQDEEGEEVVITYGALLEKASCIANSLINLGVKPDNTVAIMVPTSADFFQSFFGILLAGAIPVPIYPPFRMDRIEEYALREAKILNNAEVRVLITFAQAERLGKVIQTHVPSLNSVKTAKQLLSGSGSLPKIERTTDQPALLQYTSGSTGDPKGILLCHQNILANIRAVEKAINIQSSDVPISWLPLYHDMGLMSWIFSIYYGLPITIMSPISFLNRPERWLWAIHYHRGTLSAAPNFAYELCVKKVDEENIQGLDLSSWRLSFNGAEAVNPRTLRRFYEKFKKYGLKAEAILPVYGLAENTVGLTTPPLGREFRTDKIVKDAFEQERRAVPYQNQKDFLEFPSVGKAIPDHEIRVVDDNIHILPERHIGNIQFRGPSAMPGYYQNPVATQAVYHDGWWNTGDMGYITDGELYITGRKKDLIIKAGRNLYPEAIEEVVGQVAGVRQGCVIAFGVADVNLGTEKMIIVAEVKNIASQQHKNIINSITEAVVSQIGVPPDQVILVSPQKIPKTSSGKLQRSACKQSYLNGELTKQSSSVKLQLSKLFLTAIFKRFIRLANRSFKFVYTAYLWTLFVSFMLPVWLLILLLPRAIGAKIAKICARLLFALAFCPIDIEHKEKLVAKSPTIYVANHCSYVDSLLLLAILPAGTLFVGKKEIKDIPFIRSLAKKLGFLTVDRLDFSQNLEDTKEIVTRLQEGNSILIYPEGTFTYASGLRPFKTGAFQLAVNVQAPICPMAIQNTRKFWREGNYLFTPTTIRLTVLDLVKPLKNDWSEVIRMRTHVRRHIAQHCGEAPIDLIMAGPEIA